MAEKVIFFEVYTLPWRYKQISNNLLECTYHLTSYVSYRINFTKQFKAEFALLD